VLGGSSSINGMIYMRGQSRDFDQWARLTGDEEWTWDRCLPYFLRHEDYWRGADSFHGAGNEWRVEKQRLSWEVLEAFKAAAIEYGIPASDDFNRGTNEGVGYFEVNQKAGLRWNASQAFLNPVLKRPNLHVWTDSVVDRLTLDEERRVRGLTVLRGGQRVAVEVRREVILCAGAIGSPHILERSGIGQAERLSALGIRPIIDHPGVGENLQDHLQLRMVYQVSGVKTLNTRARRFWGKAAIAWEYLRHRSGPMSMAPSQLGCFTRSRPELAWPDLEYHVQPLSLDAFGEPLHPFDALTTSVCHLNPTSRGSVHLQSPSPFDSPLIAPNYLSTDEDRSVAVRALRLTREIMRQPAMAAYQPREFRPGLECQTEEALVDCAGRIGTTIFHPVGTCAMGPKKDPTRVLDSRFRVRGVDNLRVVDGSAMPTVTSGNTNSPILMMAERAAEWIAAT
jgi:choline dehydrogenase